MSGRTDRPRVPGGQLFFARLMRATPGFWQGLGNLETRVLGRELGGVKIDRPIYVTGLARAGTTIVTEILAAHPDVTSHHYSDFPAVWTPYWWNALRARLPLPDVEPEERAHRDRLRVTVDSPEAVEEVLWMRFFPSAHDPDVSHVLDAATENAGFERFYRDHVRKLLKVRGRRRYLAKGNYNVTRLGYLRRLFPDARFVILARQPDWHIASLMKQDRLFAGQHELNPRVTDYLKLLGHYEFGVHKHPINVGDDAAAREIVAQWRDGNAVKGWALYWRSLYGHVLEQLESDKAMRQATLLVSYEAMCREPDEWIGRILAHCGLEGEDADAIRERFAGRLSLPDYYQPDFTDAELGTIREITGPVAARLQAAAQDHSKSGECA